MNFKNILRAGLFLAPFAVIYVVLCAAPRVLERWCGMRNGIIRSWRQPGSVLEHGRALREGRVGAEYDVWFAGSSRIMAAFSAAAVARSLSDSRSETAGLTAYNLANVANDMGWFAEFLGSRPLPKLMVLEFSPHLLLNGKTNSKPIPRGASDAFMSYRKWVENLENRLADFFSVKLQMAQRVHIDADTPRDAVRLLTDPDYGLWDFVYGVLKLSNVGQLIMPDGQTAYRIYLPDRESAAKMRKKEIYLKSFSEGSLLGGLNPKAWDGFTRIVSLFEGKNEQLIMVRPPLPPEMYDLENDVGREAVDKTLSYLREKGVAYVDMSPSSYASVDLSHIEWFETGEASRELAEKLAKAIDWTRLAAALAVNP